MFCSRKCPGEQGSYYIQRFNPRSTALSFHFKLFFLAHLWHNHSLWLSVPPNHPKIPLHSHNGSCQYPLYIVVAAAVVLFEKNAKWNWQKLYECSDAPVVEKSMYKICWSTIYQTHNGLYPCQHYYLPITQYQHLFPLHNCILTVIYLQLYNVFLPSINMWSVSGSEKECMLKQ